MFFPFLFLQCPNIFLDNGRAPYFALGIMEWSQLSFQNDGTLVDTLVFPQILNQLLLFLVPLFGFQIRRQDEFRLVADSTWKGFLFLGLTMPK